MAAWSDILWPNYKQLNTRLSYGNTDTALTKAALRSSALIFPLLYKSQISACHFSRPHCESKPGEFVKMIESKVTEHTWAPIFSFAVIINVRKLARWEVARVLVEFIACSASVPQPSPAVVHLEVKYRNIPLQFILLGLVAYGTEMVSDKEQGSRILNIHLQTARSTWKHCTVLLTSFQNIT